MDRIQLSHSFFLDEFTRSQTAARLGREIVADAEVIAALRRLCVEVLQPVRNVLGPTHITSGYRPVWLNTIVGGSARSQHCLGLAADIVVTGHDPLAVCAWIAQSVVPFDQLIHEYGRWTHVSVAPVYAAPRQEVLTAWVPEPGGNTRYTEGLHDIEALRRAA